MPASLLTIFKRPVEWPRRPIVVTDTLPRPYFTLLYADRPIHCVTLAWPWTEAGADDERPEFPRTPFETIRARAKPAQPLFDLPNCLLITLLPVMSSHWIVHAATVQRRCTPWDARWATIILT